jgi:hypothetical protein
MKKHFYTSFSFLFVWIAIAATSCEEIIDPALQRAEPILVVDAWINNKVEDQVIRLTMTQPYLENVLPGGVSGASVVVSYDGGNIVFSEDAGNAGVYRWTPTELTSEEAFGELNRAYTLTVVSNGETYEATSRLKRTVPVDSITFKEITNSFYPEGSYSAEFWATDAVGAGDTYWIRTYKNGILLNKPSELNIAFDAAFSEGGNFDGITLIAPIRDVSPDEVDEDDLPISPYMPGDSVYVEIHSLTRESFTFLNEVIVQTNRPGGFGELFSTPLANVSSNIKNTNANGRKVVGFFNVAAVEGLGKKFELE